MSYQTHVLEVVGTLCDVVNSNTAIINFMLDDRAQNALMKKENFYHNGKAVAVDDGFDNFLSPGMEVKFSARGWADDEYIDCNWYVTVGWLPSVSQSNDINMRCGLMYTTGRVSSLYGRRGVIVVDLHNNARTSHRVLFLASNMYIHETRFTGKCLFEVLKINDFVQFDAFPCIPDENEERCTYFATCVYKGKRPKLASSDKENPNQTSLFNVKSNSTNGNCNGTPHEDFKSQCLSLFDYRMHQPQTLFMEGKGMVIDIIDNEFGVMLGQFKKNLFQTILFHRRSVFLDKMSLNRSNLSEILSSEDRVRFVAVAAPPRFQTNWIAVQVGIYNFSDQNELPIRDI